MTSARRSRFFIGLGILLLMFGFVAIFQSSQQQLDEIKINFLRCEQQMQGEVEKNFRLEKSLASERLVHKQSKVELQQKAKEEKEIRDKTTMESNLRFSSLQQHYKLLKIQHDDLAEDCSKSKEKQLEEINGLQGKLKSLQGKLGQIERERDKEIEHWKVKYKQLESDKSNLEKLLNQKSSNNENSDVTINQLKYNNIKLESEIEQYRKNCRFRPSTEKTNGEVKKFREIEKNFNAQISVSEDSYKIPIKLVNRSLFNNRMPPEDDKNEIKSNKSGSGVIINSVENFQIIPKPLVENFQNNQDNNLNVLQEPPSLQLKSSTAISDKKRTSENLNKIPAPIAAIPTVSSASNKSNKLLSTVTINRKLSELGGTKTKSKPVPIGVVPVPESMRDFIKHEENNSENVINQPDRYSNVIESGQLANKRGSDDPAGKSNRDDINFQNVNEIENGAHEVNDNNDFNIIEDKNHKDHLQEVLDDEKINVINNNAAEEDTNLYDNKISFNNLQKPNDDIDLEIINRRHSNVDKDLHSKNKYSNDKLMNEEIAADQGKIAYQDDFREDLHMEEQPEEEDDDEYSNLAARQQGQAVRN